jgi:plasmid stabilization system protein ParE
MAANPGKYSVSVSALALRQLDEACAYIHDQGAPLAAQRMAARFIAAIETLERQPFRGRPVDRGLYELVTVRPSATGSGATPWRSFASAMARGGQLRARGMPDELAVVSKKVVHTLPGCEAFDSGVGSVEIVGVGPGFDGQGSLG